MTDQTTMSAAFERANLLPVQSRLEKCAREAASFGEFFKKLSDDPEVALALFDIDEIEVRARQKWSEVHPDRQGNSQKDHSDTTVGNGGPGGGQTRSHDHCAVTPAWTPSDIQSSGGEAGQSPDSDDGHDVVTRRVPGHSKRSGPAYAERRAERMTTVLDTFAIIDRNGERLPVGQIYIHSYARLIKMTAKRSWRASREHALLQLLKEAADRKGVIPNDAKTEDIFEVKEFEALLDTATRIATPQLPEGERDAA